MSRAAPGGYPLLRVLGAGGGPRRCWTALRLLRAARRAERLRARNGASLGAPVPEALSLALTTRCPESCSFCGAAGSPQRLDLPEELALRLVTEAEELGAAAVLLTGGEPLLRADLAFALVEAHPRLLFLLFTSGAGLTPGLARRCRAPNLLTLVGADGERRNAAPAMAALRGAGAAFGFAAVVDATSQEAVASAGFLLRMRAAGCRVGILLERLPVGRAAGLGYGLDAAARARFRAMLAQREIELGLPLRFLPDQEDGGNGCLAAGAGVIHVNAAGFVEPCPFLHTALEDVRERTVAEVLRSPALARVRRAASGGRSAEHPCALLAAPALAAIGV